MFPFFPLYFLYFQIIRGNSRQYTSKRVLGVGIAWQLREATDKNVLMAVPLRRREVDKGRAIKGKNKEEKISMSKFRLPLSSRKGGIGRP